MRKFVSAIVLTIATTGCANAQTNEQVWGTLIGGGLGYVFGDGSGHQKEIAAASALGGALLGTHVSRSNGAYYSNSGSFNRVCARQIPPQYAYNRGARNAWIQGCTNRMAMQQYEFEQEAFQAGAQ